MNKFIKKKAYYFTLADAHTFKINTVFEMMVMHHANLEAVVMGGKSVTYYELNVLANSIAHELIRQGVLPGDIVAVKLDKSIVQVASILAVMKAGAVYLPLDPTYPFSRMQYMLQDSATRFLITSTGYLGQHSAVTEINVDTYDAQIHKNPSVETDSNSLAYIIYTSGTTGNPKGVMVQHGGFVNMCVEQIKAYQLGPDERVLQFASISFDASVYEIFIALLSGSTLVLADKETIANKSAFLNYVEAQRLTFVLLPPVFLSSLERPAFPTVKTIVTAGEACNKADALYYSKEKRFFNAYGPTETSVCASLYRVVPEGNYDNYIPIGSPILNTQFYILDELLQPVVEGETGELCISGVGLARGYINKPELTQKAFVEHPATKERIYRTGDLAKVLPDGSIVLLGRKDQQVKIAGHRIELSAIEASMLDIEPITNVLVNVYTYDQDKTLCAYFTATQSMSPDLLREKLLDVLPSFMIPHWFIQVKEFSLTTNGKVNKEALPSPREYFGSQRRQSQDLSAEQQAFLKICADVLGLDNVNLSDNFLHLGGHSLKATALIVKALKAFEVEITVADIYRSANFAEIFNLLEKGKKTSYDPLIPAAPRKYYATTAAQKRMYVMSSTDQVDVSYNVSIVLTFKDFVSQDLIQNVFSALLERHEVFRTRFLLVEGDIVQEVLSEASLHIESEIIPKEKLPLVSKSFVRPFDLSEAPLLRVGYYPLLEGGVAVLIDTHHVVADGTSMGILYEEIIDLVAGKSLPAMKLQYKDYAEWEYKHYQMPKYFQEHEAYWLPKFQHMMPWSMPTDFARGYTGFDGARTSYRLEDDLAESILLFTQTYKVSSYHLLLACFYLVIHKYSMQEDIVVGTAVANRNKEEVQDMMGMFVNMLALRKTVKPEMPFSDFVSQTKNMVLEAFQFQEYPFELLISKLGLSGSVSKMPLVNTLFIVQNIDFFDSELSDSVNLKYENATSTSKFDFSFFIRKEGQHLVLDIEFNTKLYKVESIDNLAFDYFKLIKVALSSPSSQLGSINSYDAEDIHAASLHTKNTDFIEDIEFDL